MKESIFIIAVCITASASLSREPPSRDTGNLPSQDERLEGPQTIWEGCGIFEVYRDKSRDIKFYVLHAKQTEDCKFYRDKVLKMCTCPPNQNDVFWIGHKVRLIFFSSGQVTCSVDMCPQIKSIYFLVVLHQKKLMNFRTRFWTRDTCHVYSEDTSG